MSPVAGLTDIGLPSLEPGLIRREQAPCVSRRVLPSLVSSRMWPSLPEGLPSRHFGIDFPGEPLTARMLSPAPMAISVVAVSFSPNSRLPLSRAGAKTDGRSAGLGRELLHPKVVIDFDRVDRAVGVLDDAGRAEVELARLLAAGARLAVRSGADLEVRAGGRGRYAAQGVGHGRRRTRAEVVRIAHLGDAATGVGAGHGALEGRVLGHIG